MDLIEFRRALRRHVHASLLAAILVLVVGFVEIGHPAQTYEATSTVLVTPRAEKFQNASETVLRVILPNVVVIAQSQSLFDVAKVAVPSAYRNTPVSVASALDSVASSLTVSAISKDPSAAIAWSDALAHALVARMKTDAYLDVQLLDPAEAAGVTGRKARLLSFGAVFALAVFSFILAAFGAQRLEEARDVAGALRRRGVRVLGSIATGRRHRRKADSLAAVVAVLLQDDYESGQVLVTALDDSALASWLADLLQRGEENLAGARVLGAEPEVARLAVGAGPLLDQLCLRASIDQDCPPCVLAADARRSSIGTIAAGVRRMEQAGAQCRGVVLVNESRGFRRPGADRELVS